MSPEWLPYVLIPAFVVLCGVSVLRTPLAADAICVEDCINRLTQVECLPGDCKGGSYCMNQRYVWRLLACEARSADTL